MQRSEFMELKVNVYLDLKWQNFPNGTSYIQEIGVKSLFLVGIKGHFMQYQSPSYYTWPYGVPTHFPEN